MNVRRVTLIATAVGTAVGWVAGRRRAKPYSRYFFGAPGIGFGDWHLTIPALVRGGVHDFPTPSDLPPPPSEEEEERAGERVDVTPVRRVLPVVASQTQGDITVEVPWLEVREAGFRLAVHIRNNNPPPRSEPKGGFHRQVGPFNVVKFAPLPIHSSPMPVLRVEDDLGTVYRQWQSGSGSRWPEWMRMDATLTPVISPEANRLIVTIDRLEFHGPPDWELPPPIEGPWQFDIPLR